MKTSSFETALARANSLSPDAVARLLAQHGVRYIRNATFRRTVEEDRLGIDYVVHRYGQRRPLFIDLKETSRRQGGAPVVFLETARCGKVTAPGWATDPDKWTDLFLIIHGDGSSLVLSARQVRAALQRYRDSWSSRFRTGRNATRGFYETYETEYLLVPHDVLAAACEEIAAEWRGAAKFANGGAGRPECGVKNGSPAKVANSATRVEADPRVAAVERIKSLRDQFELASPCPHLGMTLVELERMEEELVDDLLSDGWQPFPAAPFEGIPGLIEPLSDFAALKRCERRLDNASGWLRAKSARATHTSTRFVAPSPGPSSSVALASMGGGGLRVSSVYADVG